MTVNGSAEYATASAFRRALEDRLKQTAKARSRSLEELRREFLFQRFLALVFSSPDGQWVLKGGAGLLMRLAGARFSKDLDLLHLGELTAEQSVAELRQSTAPREGDHLVFVVEDGVSYSGANPVVQIRVTAYIGTRYGAFPIDLATELHMVAPPETIRPDPVVELPGLPELPEVVVYPLADQVADKVCAMFELYGKSAGVSSRYRDLVDLTLIVTSCELDGRRVAQAVASETRRRSVALPGEMRSPGPDWAAGYAAIARRSKLAPALHVTAAALEVVGECLDPILSRKRAAGVWVPGRGWTD